MSLNKFVSVLLVCLSAFLAPAVSFSGDSSHPTIDKCECPPARCDDCHMQKGIHFFTPQCHDGTILSCAQANCIAREPQPQKCMDAQMEAANAKKAAKLAEQKAIAIHQSNYGVFVVAQGDVKIIKKDGHQETAAIGKKVFAKDTIATGDNSKARILFTDNNVASLTPNSKLEISEYEFNEKEGKRNSIFFLSEGQVRNSVNQKYDGVKQKFQVKTPSAVAGVRGTEFVVNYSPKVETTKIVTFKGEVELGKSETSSGQILDSVYVKPGQSGLLSKEMPKPSAPQVLTEYDLARLDAETEVKPLTQNEQPSSLQPASPVQPERSSSRRPAAMVEAVCEAPAASLYECSWVRKGHQCVRKRCYADGVWKAEKTESDDSMCSEEPHAAACD